MISTGMTRLIAGALLTLLAGCMTDWGGQTPTVASSAQLGRVCPMPTPQAKLRLIADYLSDAPPSKGLDTLATEWERLDEGARKARAR